MISVVVPMYKVEKYLEKCVQSILAQTYKNFELILVDERSPDNCPQMSDEFAENDSRIRVLHKKNGGLSDARNAGIAIAKGEWITFIDSDDYVADDYLATLLALIEKYNADIAVTGIQTFYEGEEPRYKCVAEEYVYTSKKALEKMLYQDTLDTSACAILLPTNLAKKHLFPFGKYHEDDFTTYKYYKDVNKVAVITAKKYFYLQRKGSIMHALGQASIDELDAADNLVNFCIKYYPDIISAAESKKFSDYCQVLLCSYELKKSRPDIYRRITSYLLRQKFHMITNSKARMKNRIAALLLIMGTSFFISVGRIMKRWK